MVDIDNSIGNGGAAGSVKVHLKNVTDTGVRFTLSGCKGAVGPDSASSGSGGTGSYL